MITTRQPRHPLRWAIRALRRLNDELLASGEAMARSARAPQASPAEVIAAHRASPDKVPTGV
jgi:hypothetical protein